jgi:AcrR family transcriptional regulator
MKLKQSKASVAKTARTNKTLAKSSARRRQRRPDEVKSRILSAAFEAFTTYGYEGSSTRSIAKQSHVSLSLLLYHFRSKEQLWRAVIDYLLSRHSIAQMLKNCPSGASADERLRTVIRGAVERFAEAPGIHRLMTLEAHTLSERLTWMCTKYLKSDFNDFCEIIAEAQKRGTARKLNPARVRYAIVAIAAVPFSVSSEYKLLTKRNPFSSTEIESTIDFINTFVFK